MFYIKKFNMLFLSLLMMSFYQATALVVSGPLVDLYCWDDLNGIALDSGEDLRINPFLHTVHCLIEVGPCRSSGFAFVHQPSGNGNWVLQYLLDANGNQEAEALMLQVPINMRHRPVGFSITAEGTVGTSGTRQTLQVTPGSVRVLGSTTTPNTVGTFTNTGRTTTNTGRTTTNTGRTTTNTGRTTTNTGRTTTNTGRTTTNTGMTTTKPTTIPVITDVWNETKFQYCVSVLQMRFCWGIVKSLIYAAVRAPADSGYVGFGVTDQNGGGMVGADMIIMVNNPFEIRVRQHFSTGFFTPAIKRVQGNGTRAFISDKGQLVMYFNRSLMADGSATSNTIPLPYCEFIFAHGESGSQSLGYHGKNRAVVQVNLLTGAIGKSDNTATMVIVHAVLMSVAWSGAAIVGVFVAAFVPKNNTWWFTLHISMVSITALLTLIAFVVIVIFINNTSRLHFISNTTSATSGAHQVIGLIVFILIWLQICLGIVIDRLWRSKNLKTGNIPKTTPLDQTHWFTGRLLILIASINLVLGAVEMRSSIATGIFAAIIGAAIVLYIVLSTRRFIIQKNNIDKNKTDSH